ncbi:hypothetical protein FQR65_LT16452 [Abscondita terminalis]|nr:hypothetical protein FQR65_LT16452 [Abscondita terminalis]
MVSLTQTLASASAGQGGFAIFGAGSSISVYAQLGALIAVSIMTKNALLRKQTLGMIPLGFIGITEPILYGVNLPKKRPLIAGVLAAFVAGSFAGAIGVTARITTGIGFFEIIGYFQDTIYDMDGSIAIATGQLSKTSNGLYYILSCVMSLGLGILFGMLMYKERVTETKAVGKRNNLIQKYIITLFTKDKKTFDKNSLNQNFTNLKNLVSSEETKAIKDLEKDIQKEIKIKTKLENINEKESKILNSLKSKGASTSAYQVEGAYNADGKGLSVQDDSNGFISKLITDDITDFKVASDHYNHYKEDVALMAEMGFKSYRFSIN